jgi:hypothetical protein
MIPRKPYVKKPMVHSPRDSTVLEDVRGYLIRTFKNDGTDVIKREARVQEPGQCLAALMAAKASGLRCLVYAIGEAYGEECLAQVDGDFLKSKMR